MSNDAPRASIEKAAVIPCPLMLFPNYPTINIFGRVLMRIFNVHHFLFKTLAGNSRCSSS
jgi:hypothetical protein